MTDELLNRGRRVLNAQPFSSHLGVELDVLEPGKAQLSLPMSARLTQQHGFVHGGVLSYLADNALTFAGGSQLGDAVTVEFKINYLRPAKDGEKLLALATVVHAGKQLAVCRCDVYVTRGSERTACATAMGTIRAVS